MSEPSVWIVDYGVGNLGSVANMLRRSGSTVDFARTPEQVRRAQRLILPGVGAFDACRSAFSGVHGLEPALLEAVARRVPLLGICVGMQLLADRSEEGSLPGLGLIKGRVCRFDLGGLAQGAQTLRVPHMAWAVVEPRNDGTLFDGSAAGASRFYFVHSYHVVCDDPKDIAATAHHGIEFTAAVQRGRVFGVQFHPEKSHRFGLELLRRFASLPVEVGHG